MRRVDLREHLILARRADSSASPAVLRLSTNVSNAQLRNNLKGRSVVSVFDRKIAPWEVSRTPRQIDDGRYTSHNRADYEGQRLRPWAMPSLSSRA